MDMDTMANNAAFFSKMWMEFASKMMTGGLSFNPMAPPAENAKQMRTNVFGMMSDFAEEFMRSPQFLQVMKQSMDSFNGFRKQANDFMTGFRHDTQGTAREDIDSLMVSVRRLGTRMLDRMDDLESRLDQIVDRLDEMQGNGSRSAKPAAKTLNDRDRPANGRPSTSRAAQGRRKPARNAGHETL